MLLMLLGSQLLHTIVRLPKQALGTGMAQNRFRILILFVLLLMHLGLMLTLVAVIIVLMMTAKFRAHTDRLLRRRWLFGTMLLDQRGALVVSWVLLL